MLKNYTSLPSINPLLLLRYLTVEASTDEGVHILDLLVHLASSPGCPDKAQAEALLAYLAQMLPITASKSKATAALRDILEYLGMKLTPLR